MASDRVKSKLIKLTHAPDKKDYWVNVDHIVYLRETPQHVIVTISSGDFYKVEEDFETLRGRINYAIC